MDSSLAENFEKLRTVDPKYGLSAPIVAESREASLQEERLDRMKQLLFAHEQAFLHGWQPTAQA